MSYSSDDDDDKPLVFRSNAKPTSNPPPIPSNDPDSDDDKPLSSTVRKGNTNQVKNGVHTDVFKAPEPQVKDEDSDDEKSLSSEFASKVSVGSSNKVCQNGSKNIGANKRLLVEEKPSGQSSIKKPKLSDSKAETNSSNDEDDDDDDLPIAQRKKNQAPSSSKPSSSKQNVINKNSSTLNQTNKKSKKIVKKSQYLKPSIVQPGSGKGQKWNTLVHNGLMFPPEYKPHGVKMLYKGKPVDLSPEQEEVATMFAVMLDTIYMTNPKFKENFWDDWRKILGKNHVIQNLEDCDFKPIYEWHQSQKEKKKQMSTEEKKAQIEETKKLEEKYMWAVVDGVKEKVGNFRVEPPRLFLGRWDHPKMGKLKRRIRPSDITINIGKDAPIPECPIPGESWKEITHDNTVTWLAYWSDPINIKGLRYAWLAASRLLKGHIKGIRNATKDFANKDVTKRQIAVVTYLIDKLALRAGNEKDDDEADTVGCCTLKVKYLKV